MNRTEKLAALRNPEYAGKMALSEVLGRVQVIKGDPGRTPIKGVDYFTHDEVMEVANYIRSLIHDGKDGKTPVKNFDYFDGVAGAPGRHGVTPERGVDYWHEADRAAIVKEVRSLVKDGKDAQVPSIETIVSAVMDTMAVRPLKYSLLEGGPDPKDLKDLVEFLKRGGYRGGGSASSGGSATPLTPVGAVDAVNNVFTVVSRPSSVVSDGITYYEGFGYTYLANVITLDVPPSQYIRYYA